MKRIFNVFWRIGRILKNPSTVRMLCMRLGECLSFRRAYGFLASIGTPDSNRTVLVVNLTDIPAYAKWEGMLLLSLRMKGCTPVVLTERGYRWTQHIFRTFGICRFIYLDDLLDRTKDRVDYSSIDTLFEGDVRFKALLGYTYRSIDCGNAALSTLVRKLRSTGLKFQDPIVQEMLKDAFRRSVRIVHAAEMLFDEHTFEAVLFHEKGYTPFGELYHSAVLHDLNVVQYHYAQKPKSFVLKRYNKANRKQHPFSLSEQSWKHVQLLDWPKSEEDVFMDILHESYEAGTWFNRKALLADKSLQSPEIVRKELGIDPKKKVAMIFSHVLWDASFFFGESLFDDYEHWLVETVKAACANDAVQWYIKLHPDYIWKMKDMGAGVKPQDVLAIESDVGTLPDHVRVIPPETSITTYSFFPVIDYCITVRGTIGLEAPCFGIPVFTAGTGRYSNMGISVDSSSPEEYLERMRSIQEYPKLNDEETSLARRHAWAVFEKRIIIFHAFELTRKLKNYGLETHVEIPLRTKEEVESAEDLKAFADWVIDSRDEDFLTV